MDIMVGMDPAADAATFLAYGLSLLGTLVGIFLTGRL
jgi:hypothetical protein